MKYLKSLAVFVAVCMMLSVIPVISYATGGAGSVIASDSTEAEPAPQTTDNPDATEEPEATPEITAEPEATAEPDATADPDATEEPSVTEDPDTTADPNATEAPDTTADPNVTADPNATATPAPSTTPSAQYKITVDPTEKSEIKTLVNSNQTSSANSGARVTISGRAERGNIYINVYYENSAHEKTNIISRETERFEQTITMPASDIVIYAEVKAMTPQQLYTSATQQYNTVTSNISTYKTRYINNSANYNASDIREMNGYIKEAENLLPSLRSSYTDLNSLIRDDAVTDVAVSDVIYMQKELDRVTDPMDEIADRLGAGSDYYSLDLSLTTRGGKVSVSGAVSGAVDASRGANSELFNDVPIDSSLTFRITTQTGYMLNTFRINGRNMTVNGSTLSLSASSISNYITDGTMKVTVSFTQNYGGNTYGGNVYGGGSTYTGSSNNNNTVINGGTNGTQPGVNTQAGAFTDLDGVEWAVPSITALYGMGIINGMGDGRFEPQSNVTREQFAKMIVGVMGYTVDQNATTSFSDANGDWYTPYIAAAVQNGIINGRDDGTFGVGDNITRQDIAVIIYRTQGSPAVEIHEFPDSASISDYATQAVSYLFERQIATGDDQGNFNPTNPATRAEASKMLYGLYTLTH